MSAITDLHALRDRLKPSARMPVVFLDHGSPMNALEDTEYSRAWTELGKSLPEPAAILVASAHWMTRGTTLVDVSTLPKTIQMWAKSRVFTVCNARVDSLDAALAADDERVLGELVAMPDEGEADGLGDIANDVRLDQWLSELSPRSREVLERRFGLHDHAVQSLAEVAQVLGVSRERVRQIEAEALARLRVRARH